jgi:hypothetical protein
MLEEIDPIDFILAENLGMSLGQVRALPNSEIVEWRAFLRYRAEMQKLHS